MATSKKSKLPVEGKVEEAAVEAAEKPEGEKKPRAPRQDYGFRKGCVITLSGEEKTYRGKRAEIYAILKKYDGKPAEKFLEAAKSVLEDESARSWLKFFVSDSAASLSGGEEEE